MNLQKKYSPKILISLMLVLLTGLTLSITRNTSLDSKYPSLTPKTTLLEADKKAQLHISKNYAKLPLSFETNNGQTDSSVNFISRGNGYALFLTATSAVMSLNKPQSTNKQNRKSPKLENIISPKTDELLEESQMLKESEQTAILRMELVGANPNSKIFGLEKLTSKSNYFIGNNPSSWSIDVAQYAKVQYQEVYPGIDMLYYGNQHDLEYDLIVKKGASAKQIKLSFPTSTSLKLNEQGDLLIKLNDEQVCKHKPVAYQTINGTKQIVEANYILEENNQVSFNLENYNINEPLVIDPVLTYSTYLGGSDSDRDRGFSIAVDNMGNTYLTGVTTSADFPTKNPIQSSFAGNVDVFVAKISPSGDSLVYSTYLGGRDDDRAFSIAVDNNGNAYLTGLTTSTNFPTKNARSSFAGKIDAFITKINPSGDSLVYSTYLGGSGNDEALSIAVDSVGNAYLAGFTTSTNFPTKNPIQASFAGKVDAFVTKMNPSGDSLVYSTYLGGNSEDEGSSIAVDNTGNTYLTGFTISKNFPTKNPIQASFAEGQNFGDAFVAKINSSGNDLTYSTYLGGSNDDLGTAVAIDSAGNAYLTGVTSSTDFPTKDPIQPSFGGGPFDMFVTKINPSGNTFVYSTYFGGSGDDEGLGIAVDNTGNAYLTGSTGSKNFPTKNPIQASFAGGSFDAFVTQITDMTSTPTDGDFAITFPQPQLTVSKGSKGQFIVNITRLSGFDKMVSISPDLTQLHNLKIKLKTPSPQSTNSVQVTFDFKVKLTAPSGNQQIVFTGQDDLGRTRQNTLNLVIK